MHVGTHLAVSYLAFFWAAPDPLAASLVGAVFPDCAFAPVQIYGFLKRQSFETALGRWRRNRYYRIIDFSVQSLPLAASSVLVVAAAGAALPSWTLYFAVNWFMQIFADLLTHTKADLDKVAIRWPMWWPVSSKIVAYGLVSDGNPKFRKFEFAVMALAVMLFLFRTYEGLGL